MALKTILFGSLVFALTGCSTIERMTTARTADREFRVRSAWIRTAPTEQAVGYRKINRATPLLAGDLLLSFNSVDGLVAYDREGGFERWRLPVVNGIEGGAALIRDRLFFGGSDGQFYSVNARTGEVNWTYATKAEVLGEPLIDGENALVYFVTSTNVVHALEADSGRVKWLFTRPDISALSIRGSARPALAGGRLFAGFNDGVLVALDASTGRQIWEIALNRNKRFKDIDTSPVVDGDRVYVAGYDDKLYCVSAERGEILWRQDGGGFAGLTLAESRLYYPTSNGEIRAIERDSGKIIWTYKVERGIASSVVPYRGVLVFGESRGFLRFLDPATGKSIAEYEPGRGVFSTPRVDEKSQRVYFISNESNVYAIEAGWAQKPGIRYLAR